MPTIHYVDSVTSAGKTHNAIDFAVSLPAENFCFVMPSTQLINKTVDDLKKRHPQARKRVRYFYSGLGDGSVTGQIAEHLKTAPTGVIIFITHAAWQMLPHFHLKQDWHLIVDEAMQTTYCEAFTLSENREHLIKLLDVVPENDTYSRIIAADTPGIVKVAANKNCDQITEIFKALAGKLVDLTSWMISVETEQWQAFIAGKINQIEFHGRFHPCAFAGYSTVTFMAANLKETLTYKQFVNLGVEFRPHKRIINKLRYTQHRNGARLKIKYFTNRLWSKNLHRKKLSHNGEQISVFSLYRDAIEHEFGEHPFLYMANKGDMYENALPKGHRLPNCPHGLNYFQEYNRCAILSALNPTPAHGVFLQEMASIDAFQVRRALLSEVAYQALGRGSIRNPDATEEFVLVVPDRITAEHIAALYPGATTELLMGYDPVPAQGKPGPNRKYESDDDREQARRAQWVAAKRRERFKDVNGSAKRRERFKDVNGVPLYTKEFESQTDQTVPRASSSSGNGEIHVSIWHGRAAKPREPRYFEPIFDKNLVSQDLHTSNEFSVMLRNCAATKMYADKFDNYLFSPARFDLSRDPGHGHSNANVVDVTGIALDFDHTDLTPEKVASILPYQMALYSSWSHATDNVSFRVVMPTTTAMTGAHSEAIRRMMVKKFRDFGYQDKEYAGLHHGIDLGKMYPAALFFLPCSRPNGFYIEYTDQPVLNPSDWIQNCPNDIIDRLCPPGPDEFVAPQFDNTPEYLDRNIESACKYWQAHGCVKGNARHKFFGLAVNLAKAGCDQAQMRSVLQEQAEFYRHNPAERRAEIDGLLRNPKIINP